MVTGRIEFVPDRPQLSAADVHVWIEDTTYADAYAARVFHHQMSQVAYRGEPEGIPFTLDYNPQRPAGHTYTLSALVDLDGDGRPGRGDYVSFQAVAIPQEGTVACVRVQRIA